jgi:hypothetical protein
MNREKKIGEKNSFAWIKKAGYADMREYFANSQIEATRIACSAHNAAVRYGRKIETKADAQDGLLRVWIAK